MIRKFHSKMKRKIKQWLERTIEPKKGCLCIWACVHFNIKDVLTYLAIINEGKTKIKYKKRNSNCIVTSKRQKRNFLPLLMILSK